MSSTINVQNPKQTIESCFKSNHYVVPPFQREYVWGPSEIEQLIYDVEESFEKDREKEYFVGTTVVFEDGEKKQLIDGQQRMTTFFLILCAITKEYIAHGVDETTFKNLIITSKVDANGVPIVSYSLELQYPASTNCLANIWRDQIPADTSALPESSKRIYEGYDTIVKRLRMDFSDFNDYMRFASFFVNKVIFIQIGATNINDALKIFETINQRGMVLNPMDLMKNMLFMNIDESQFDQLNTAWRKMIDSLEQIHEKPLRFLRYYITATYDISDVKPDYQGIIDEDGIYNWLVENEGQCNYRNDPMGFTQKMINGLEYYKHLLAADASIPGRVYLMNIRFLMGKSYRLHLVPLLSAAHLDPTLLTKLLKCFEVVIFYSVVNKIKSNTIERLFSSWCPIIRDIRTEQDYKAFIDGKVKLVFSNWEKNYYQSFMNLSLNNTQKYKIKMILARIAKYIDSYRAQAPLDSDINAYLQSNNEIEHIMPKICGSNMASYGTKDINEYDTFKNMLGNLTLLEKTLNSTIQNDAYAEKCKAYKNSTFYITKSLPGLVYVGQNTAVNRMNQKMKCWTNWNLNTIQDRQEMLYNLSKVIWTLD